jgi:VanZ family protein
MAVLAYAGLIFLLSSVSTFPEVVPSFFGFDKIVHFFEYFIFGWLIDRWLLVEKNRFLDHYATFLTILIGTVYALSDEWHQSYVPGRDASLWDALFDMMGIMAASMTCRMIKKHFSPVQEIALRSGKEFFR